MTSPIEAMAKAIGSTDLSKPGWADVAARAALLALADCEIPENVSQAGADAVNEPVMQIYEEEAEKCFRAMLRAIATGG